jgi:4-diphosphocytidyl-2-C-methyl-D-erythritol kinase
MRLVLESFAKINLFLEVLGKRPDGYHDLRTVLQTVSIADTLVFDESDGVEVLSDDPAAPGGEENIVHRAALLLRDCGGVERGCKVTIQKRIPVEAGLGGGSGDAAATLAGLVRFWELSPPAGRLAELAAELGSDVPFFLQGGTRLCEGRGERVERACRIPAGTRFLVVTPDLRLPTSFVYKEFDRRALTGGGPSSNLRQAPELDPGNVLRSLFNRLEDTVLPAFPSVHETKGRMESHCPAGVLMSGSGPSLFGVLPPSVAGEESLLDDFRDCRFAGIAHPTPSGYRYLPPLRMGLSNEGGGRHGD